MSYLDYVNFYSINAGNRGKITKRGRKNINWLYSLKVNDKVDIFDKHRSTNGWYIGTILEMHKEETTFELKVHYDGWKDKFDEFVTIDCNQATSNRIKRFHTFTPYHYYLSIESAKPCKWNTRSSQWKRCEICGRKCCVDCFLVANQCRDCVYKLEEENIFHSIYSSVYSEYSIDIHIVYLIVNYSLGIVVQCSNTIKPCYNEINYESAFEVGKHSNDSTIHHDCYSYKPKYFGAGTVNICGENRRIFCESCTKHNITCCSRENCWIRECGSDPVICCNHNIVPCALCGAVEDEGAEQITECVCCGEMHCVCCNVYRCADCKQCAVNVELVVNSDPCICVDCYGILDIWSAYDEEYADYRLDDEYINKYHRNERQCKRERERNGREKRHNLPEYYHRKYTKRKNLKYHNKLNKMLMCNISV